MSNRQNWKIGWVAFILLVTLLFAPNVRAYERQRIIIVPINQEGGGGPDPAYLYANKEMQVNPSLDPANSPLTIEAETKNCTLPSMTAVLSGEFPTPIPGYEGQWGSVIYYEGYVSMYFQGEAGNSCYFSLSGEANAEFDMDGAFWDFYDEQEVWQDASSDDITGREYIEIRMTEYPEGVRTDFTGPQLFLMGPPNTMPAGSEEVTIGFEAFDEEGEVDGIIVTDGGGERAANEGSVTVSLVPGENTITFRAWDKDQNETIVTHTITVSEETSPPEITLLSPTDGYSTYLETITVSGEARGTEASLDRVEVNGILANIVGESYSTQVPLQNYGSQTITATAFDVNGGEASAQITVTRLGPVAITISTPSNGYATKSVSPITVDGYVTSTDLVSVVVNGVTATVIGNVFTADGVTVAEGTTQITATATYPENFTESDSVSYIVDNQPPVLSLLSPQDQDVTAEDNILVLGTVSDSLPVNVSVNGLPAAVVAGSFSVNISLQNGANTIEVSGADSLGNTSTVPPITVFSEATPPTLIVTTPLEGAQFSANDLQYQEMEWEDLASPPSHYWLRYRGNCATYAGRMFSFWQGSEGGFVDEYDPATNSWISRTSSPVARSSIFSAVPMADGIHLIGATTSHDVYLPASDSWQTRADLPEALYMKAAVAYDGTIYAFGGVGSYSTSVYAYSSKNDSWSTKTPIPVGIRYHSAALVDDKVYILGGQRDNSVYRDKVLIYSPATDSWTTGTEGPIEREYATAITRSGKIYLFGGNGNRTPIDIYSPAADSWSRLPEQQVYFASGAKLNGDIYLIVEDYGFKRFQLPMHQLTVSGTATDDLEVASVLVDGEECAITGTNFSGQTQAEPGADFTRVRAIDTAGNEAQSTVNFLVENTPPTLAISSPTEGAALTKVQYLPSETKWSNLENMLTARSRPACVLIGQKIHTFGRDTIDGDGERTHEVYDLGTNLWHAKAQVPYDIRNEFVASATSQFVYLIGYSGTFRYEEATNSWTQLATPSNYWDDCAALAVDNMIYLIGGRTGSYSAACERYDTQTDTWTTLASMSVPRSYAQAIAKDGKIFVVGGYDGGYKSDVEVYDIATDTWQTKSSLPYWAYDHTLTVVNNELHLFGGYTQETRHLQYDDATDSWLSLTALSQARRGMGTVSNGVSAFLLGGYVDGDASNLVERYTPGSWYVDLIATAEDADSGIAELRCNSFVALDAEGQYTARIPVRVGDNQAIVVAKDNLGNSTASTINFSVVGIPPVLEVSLPHQDTIFTSSPIDVTGTVSAPDLDRVTVNGVEVSVSSGQFTTSTTLSENVNIIEVLATTTAGMSTKVTRRVELDTLAPQIALTQPTPDFHTKEPNLTVFGNYIEPHLTELTINGNAAGLFGEDVFQGTVELTDGENFVEVSASDSLGRTTIVTRTVTLDRVMPVLTISQPIDGATTSSPTIVVKGQAIDDNLHSVTVDFLPAAINGTEYSLQFDLEEDTTRTFTVRATDKAGNVTSAQVTITRLPTRPNLQIAIVTAPIEGLAGKSIDVSWVTTNTGDAPTTGVWQEHVYLSTDTTLDGADVNLFQLAHDGSQLQPQSNIARMATVNIPQGTEGTHYIIVKADTADQIVEHNEDDNTNASANINIIYDATPPFVQTHSPKGLQKTAIDNVKLTFSEILNTSTFDTNDLALQGPQGNIAITGLAYLGSNEWQATFSPQTANGQYRIVVGTNIEDLAGNSLEPAYEGVFYLSTLPEQKVLLATLSGDKTTEVLNLATTLNSLGADVTRQELVTEGQIEQLLSSGQYEQVWFVDFSENADNFTTDWQAIKDWYETNERPIIADGRLLDEQPLIENYYENLKKRQGGLVLLTTSNAISQGMNILCQSLELNDFTETTSGAVLELDQGHELVTYPNKIEATEIAKDVVVKPSFGLQQKPEALHAVSWIGGTNYEPVITTTIQGTIGLRATITQPENETVFPIGSDVDLAATATNTVDPTFYTWYSSKSGIIASGQSIKATDLSSGTQTITVIAHDTTGCADEASIEIALENRPDFIVENLSWTPADNIDSETTVILSADIRNIGTKASNIAFSAEFQIDGQMVATSFVSPLAINESQTTTAVWTAKPGVHELKVIADFAKAVPEISDENNANSATLPNIGDKTAPADVTALKVSASSATELRFTWNLSANTENDLVEYRAYWDGSTTAINLTTETTSYLKDNLTAATKYENFKITTVDALGNESDGVTVPAVTLINNPTNLQGEAYSGYVTLNWDATGCPQELVSNFAVYSSTSPYTDVTAMTPVRTVETTSTKVIGLQNGITHYFAVTAINASRLEQKTVTPIALTPIRDTDPPVISNMQFAGQAMTQGAAITDSGALTAIISDHSGLSRVEFIVDNATAKTDFSGTPTPSFPWYPALSEDGPHILGIKATDSVGNVAIETYQVQVTAVPPAPPTITSPAPNTMTAKTHITVIGKTEPKAEVLFYRGATFLNQITTADSRGYFERPISLVEGANELRAAGRTRAGTGTLSAAVLVTRDSTIPGKPFNVEATPQVAGEILLSWDAPIGVVLQGFHVYRSTERFTATTQAIQLRAEPILENTLLNLPPVDGKYYYGVTAISKTGQVSELSYVVEATSDSVGPKALEVTYQPTALHPVTGAFGLGVVNVNLKVSEPLLTTPFLSMNGLNLPTMNVELTKKADLEYSGYFVINKEDVAGNAYAVFSGRDLASNRGTAIETGTHIKIDTRGPKVVELAISPSEPVENFETAPAQVTVTFGLDEEAEGSPQLHYVLDDGAPVEITNLQQLAPTSGVVQVWQGSFTLPGDAGLDNAETLSFNYSGQDVLGNVATEISGKNAFQIFQGDLPPLPAPLVLKGWPRPAGQIELSWSEVEGASGYKVFRKTQGTEYAEVGEVSGQVSFTDSPPAEDSYTYVVATVRHVNDKTAVSGYSPSVTIDSDATTPAAPAALNLELMAQGIHATWQAISEPEARYALYRSETEITDVSGLTPVVSDIEGTEAIDEEPSVTHHYYAVTALDEAGNESAPSPSVYLNFSLLPVRQLAVEQRDTLQPVVTWLHPGGDIEGFHVYVNGQQVTLIPQAETSFTDTGYSDGVDRTFEIVAVDALGEEGPKNKVVLPAVVALPQEGEAIKRNIMNRVSVDVTNSSSEDIPEAKVALEIAGVQYPEDTVLVRANDTDYVSLVVPGESSLEDTVPVTTTLVISKEGTTARRIRTGTLPVSYSSLVLVVMSEGTTRGGEGRVRFVLENTGNASIDLVTAGGPQAETVITLLDEDKNVLATAGYEQKLGENVTTLSNGYTVARIAPGSVFSSQVTTMAIPANAPDQVTFEVDVTQVHYGMDTDQHVALAGPTSRKNVTLIDTSYVGQITQVTPEVSFGGQEITITGRSVKRTDGTTTAYVPLRLVVSHNGLERRYTVSTDQNGYFSYGFTPQGDEAGEYETWVTHPDVDEAANRVSFKITKLAIAPAEQTIIAPYNVERSGKVTVTAAKGTVATNLRLSYLPQDQPGGAFMTGVFVTLPTTPVIVDTQEPVDLAFTVSATADAPSTGTLVFALTADERPGSDFGKAIVNVAFDSVKPVFVHTPTLVETGVEPGTSVNELVELANTGLGAAIDTQVALLTDTGQPAPIWASLASAASLGDIEPGGKAQVTLFFAPTVSVTEGVYDFLLRVTNSASEDFDVPISVAVTSNPVGGLLFKVSDIYTGTIDRETQELIEGLEGARVSMTQVEDPSFVRTLETDDAGEAFFQDLPAGRYQARISGGSHESVVRQVVVRPGVTGTEAVFLQNVLVSVEWRVTETTIEDHYTITLDATFETEVPAAVVVANPASVELPAMSPGDVYMGEFTLTNHGLIQAQEFYMSKPDGKGFFDIELLAEIPDTLAAHQVLTVPYRVVCLRALTDSSGTGGADECYGFYTYTQGGFSYVCANGNKSRGSVSHYMTRATGRCGHEDVGHDDSGAGADVPPISASAVELDGVDCWPFPGGCPTCDKCPPERNTGVGSEVNGFLGQYTDEQTDLRVKVRGGYINITRYYYADVKEFYINRPKGSEGVTVHEQYVYAWRFNHGKHGRLLTHPLAKELGTVSSKSNLYIGGAKYEPEGSRWVRDYNFIVATPSGDGYRWQSTDGDWKLFDNSGYLQSYGDRYGPIATMIYEADGKTLTGISDRNGDQVIWFENATADGTFTAVRDYTGRRVDYNMSYEMAYAEQAGIPSPTLQIYSVTQHPDRNDSSKDRTATYTYEPNGVAIQSDIDGDGDLDNVPINAFYLTHAEELDGRTKTITYSPLGLAKKVDDGHGAIYTFDYKYEASTAQYKTTVTLPCGRVKSVTFSKDGEVESTVINGKTVATYAGPERKRVSVDEGGRATQREYDEFGNLTKKTYPNGTTESWVYDTELNLPLRYVDKLGVVTEKEYSSEGNLLKMSEAVGRDLERLTVYTYNDDGQTLNRTVSGKNGEDAITVSWTYNDKGSVASDTDGEGHTAHYDLFDAEGNNLERRDRRGYTLKQEFDELGRLVKTISPPDPLGRNAIVQYEHDRAGNVVKTTDPEGNVTRKEFDHKGRETASIDALGARTERTYNAAGQLSSVTDARGNTTSYVYDDRGRQVAVVDPLGYAEVTEYDEQGRVLARIDKEGFATTFVYKPNTNLIAEQIDARGNITRTFYDLADRVEAVVDPLGKRTEVEYNEHGLQTIVRRFLNGNPVEKKTVYDIHNRKVVEIDEAGNETNFEFDSNSRIVKTIHPPNDDGVRPVVARGYDEDANLTSLTSALSHTTEFSFDALARLERITDPMGHAISYERDLNGSIVKKTDSKGQDTNYIYNSNKQLVHVTYADGEWARLSYDLVGNRTSVVGTCGTTATTLTLTQAFDELNRVTSQENDDNMRQLQYTYTPRGLRASLRLFNVEKSIDEQTTQYTWNENGQIQKILPWIGKPIEFEYRADGTKQSVTLPNGMRRTYSFNELNQLTELLYKDQEEQDVAFFRYSYGPSGNVLSFTDNEGLSLFEYNSLNWLTRADYPDGAWEQFSYDLEGNRVTLDTEAGLTEYSYNASNRLLRERGARNVDYGWDDNGNLIAKTTENGTETYHWNARDRLMQLVHADGQSIQNTYLPMSNLRRSARNGSDPEKKYVWDMLTSNSVQVISPEEFAVTDYINGMHVDELYGKTHVGNPYTYLTDALGSVRGVCAGYGSPMNTYDYKVFGEVRHVKEAIPNERKFASRNAIDSSSLYFNRARYLDSSSGRFVSSDYLEHDEMNQAQLPENDLLRFLDRYNYAKNNPMSYLDPSGHISTPGLILVIAVAAASVLGVIDVLIGIGQRCHAGLKMDDYVNVTSYEDACYKACVWATSSSIWRMFIGFERILRVDVFGTKETEDIILGLDKGLMIGKKVTAHINAAKHCQEECGIDCKKSAE